MTIFEFEPDAPMSKVVSVGVVAGATGVVTMLGGDPFTGAHNGAGDYTLTKTTGAWSANSWLSITPTVGDTIFSQNGPIGATAGVLTQNNAGAAADRDFIVAVHSVVS